MHRRGFIALSTALLLPSLAVAGQPRAERRLGLGRVAEIRADLCDYARSLPTNHAIGSAWLDAQVPQPALEQLLDAMAAQLAETRFSDTQHRDLTSLVAVQVRRDFETGHLVNLNGWMLSATETRLCGIACLLAAPAALS